MSSPSCTVLDDQRLPLTTILGSRFSEQLLRSPQSVSIHHRKELDDIHDSIGLEASIRSRRAYLEWEVSFCIFSGGIVLERSCSSLSFRCRVALCPRRQ